MGSGYFGDIKFNINDNNDKLKLPTKRYSTLNKTKKSLFTSQVSNEKPF